MAAACVAGTDTAAEDNPSTEDNPDLGTGGQLTQTVELLAFFLEFCVKGT